MVSASASPAGTPADPLISVSQLQGAFATSLRNAIHGALNSATDMSLNRLNNVFRQRTGYSFAQRFTPISLSAGESVALSTGSSFIMLSGSADITVEHGSVINISTAGQVPSGTQLVQFQRYFIVENTSALITARSPTTGHVDGFYSLGGASLPTQMPLPFLDVPPDSWFFEAVGFVFENLLFTGTSPTTFSPNSPMTRAMFVTVLHRHAGTPPVGAGGGFSDVVDPGRYYFDAVAWASANGIVTGFADGTFAPNTAITREQMAAIMFRYATHSSRDMAAPGNAFDTFPDRGAISGYAVEAMRWAVAWEIIRGSGGRLLPRNTATRAEVAQIIYNFEAGSL